MVALVSCVGFQTVGAIVMTCLALLVASSIEAVDDKTAKECASKAGQGNTLSEQEKAKVLKIMGEIHEAAMKDEGEPSDEKIKANLMELEKKVNECPEITIKEEAHKFALEFGICIMTKVMDQHLKDCPEAAKANNGKVTSEELVKYGLMRLLGSKNVTEDERRKKIVQDLGEEKAKVLTQVRESMKKCMMEKKPPSKKAK